MMKLLSISFAAILATTASTLAADQDVVRRILSPSVQATYPRAGWVAEIADAKLRAKLNAAMPEIQRAAKAWRQTDALRQAVVAAGGKIDFAPGGPDWLRQVAGDDAMKLFDTPVALDLYNGNNPLKGKGGRNTTVTDAWLEQLAGITTLRQLNLANCQIEGPGLRHIGTLTGLTNLNLTLTPVSDDGLRHLASLTELRGLGLASTQCTGTGFAHLRKLKHLESVNFHFTPLSDAGLAAISQVPISGRLWFAHTKFTDAGAGALAKLGQLRICGIGSKAPGSSGAAVAALVKLPLEDLSLLDNQASPEGLAHAAKIQTLRRLDVSYAPTVGDESLRLVARLPALQEFRIGGTKLVTDDGLRSLAGTKGLRKVSLQRLTGVSPEGIDQLRKARPDLEIEVK